MTTETTPQEAVRVEPVVGWRTMDTAPQTGKDILLWCKDTNEQFVGYWHNKHAGWIYALGGDGTRFQCVPDFWMPLPEPPNAKLTGSAP